MHAIEIKRFLFSSCNDKGVLIFKVHDLEHALAMNCSFERVVLIIRNPFRAILSEYNRQGANHTGYVNEGSFKDKGEQVFSKRSSRLTMTY